MSYSRFNMQEMALLPTPGKLKYLEDFISKSGRLSDIKLALEHVLRNEAEPHQYLLMSSLL